MQFISLKKKSQQPNPSLKSDPTCTACFHLSCSVFHNFVQLSVAGWVRLAAFVRSHPMIPKTRFILAFVASALMSCHRSPIINRSMIQKEVSIEECESEHKERRSTLLPGVKANEDWEAGWQVFRKSIRPGDRILQWYDPVHRCGGYAIERNGQIRATFELFKQSPPDNKVPSVVECTFQPNRPAA